LPRYDLAGLLPPRGQTVKGARAEAAALLFDPGSLARARLGPVRPNPGFDRSPALAFAMRPGASIATGLFGHRRLLEVAPSPEGLSKLRLSPADLAHLREDLADLRIVDAQSRQWPYLLERADAVELVPLTVEPPDVKNRASRHRLGLPVTPLRLDGVTLDAEAAYFDREYELLARVGEEKDRVLARGRLVRRAGDLASVEIRFPPARVVSLDLLVQDGDDAPLVLRSVRARVPVPEVYLAAPAGSYSLLLGSPDEAAPLYELARVRDVVLAVSAAPLTAGDLAPNPDSSLPARLARGGLRQQVILWAVLIVAVAVLAWLTLRLARKEGTPPPPRMP
jgi:hypothetical protein